MNPTGLRPMSVVGGGGAGWRRERFSLSLTNNSKQWRCWCQRWELRCGFFFRFAVIIIGFFVVDSGGFEISASFVSPLVFFEGNGEAQPNSGETFHCYHFMLRYNRSRTAPKEAFDFKVLVLCLHDTHVKLEIHLSLPDNNVQNGASCMNHYLQPGVVLLMNMHEPGEGRREVFATCLLAGPVW